MQSSLGCWPPSSWRARWLPSSPYGGHQRCCLSLSIPLFSLISFQCRSQAVIESSIGCLPLSVLSPSSSSTWWAHPTTCSTWRTTRSPPSPLHGWHNPSTRRFDALQSTSYFNQASKWWLWWLVNGNVITVAVQWFGTNLLCLFVFSVWRILCVFVFLCSNSVFLWCILLWIPSVRKKHISHIVHRIFFCSLMKGRPVDI